MESCPSCGSVIRDRNQIVGEGKYCPNGWHDSGNPEQNLSVNQKFICSLCLFKPKPENPDNDDTLTVIGGEMVCVDHQGYVTPISGARQYILTHDD